MATKPPHVTGFVPVDVPSGHYFWLQVAGYIHITSESHEKNVLESIHKHWIGPEIQERLAQKRIDLETFRIQQSLILTPKDDISQVFFNDEITLKGEVKLKWKTDLRPGDPIRIGHVKDLIYAIPANIEEDTGFVWLYHDGSRYQVWFDFTVHAPDSPEECRDVQATVGNSIARYFIERYFHDVFDVAESVRNQMLSDGWCPALCMIPYPYNAMVNAYDEGNIEHANQLATAFFDQQMLDTITSQWWSSPTFQDRKYILQTGVSHYSNRDWISCISVLVPQIEGIIMDERIKAQLGTVRHNKMVTTLPQIAHPNSVNSYLPRKVLDSFMEYLEEVFLQDFDRTQPTIRVGRHSFAHGATTQFTQIAALQTVVALDSLYHTLVY